MVYTQAEKNWLKSHGRSDEQVAAAEAAGLPFVDLLAMILNLAPMVIQMIQQLINLFHAPKAA